MSIEIDALSFTGCNMDRLPGGVVAIDMGVPMFEGAISLELPEKLLPTADKGRVGLTYETPSIEQPPRDLSIFMFEPADALLQAFHGKNGKRPNDNTIFHQPHQGPLNVSWNDQTRLYEVNVDPETVKSKHLLDLFIGLVACGGVAKLGQRPTY